MAPQWNTTSPGHPCARCCCSHAHLPQRTVRDRGAWGFAALHPESRWGWSQRRSRHFNGAGSLCVAFHQPRSVGFLTSMLDAGCRMPIVDLYVNHSHSRFLRFPHRHERSSIRSTLQVKPVRLAMCPPTHPCPSLTRRRRAPWPGPRPE